MVVPFEGRARGITLASPILWSTHMAVPVRCRRVLVALLLVPLAALADSPSGYQKPPEAIRKILDLPPAPAVSLSPNRDYLVLAEQQRYPTIADLARPILRIAGLRID